MSIVSFPSGSSRSPRRGPGFASCGSRALWASRRRALAVRAVRRTWSVRSVWRARRQETAPTCRLASVRRADGVAPDITIFRQSCAARCAAGLGLTANGALFPPRGTARTSPATTDHGVPRDGTRGVGPWGCFSAVRVGNERGLLPGFLDAATQRTRLAEASGPASRLAGTLRRAPKINHCAKGELHKGIASSHLCNIRPYRCTVSRTTLFCASAALDNCAHSTSNS